MRILHLTESFWPRIGGAEVFTGQLASHLQSRGHACAVVTNQPGGLPAHEQLDGLNVHRLPLARALLDRDLPALTRLSAQLRELALAWRPDLLHLHTTQPAAFFYLRLARSLNLPLLFTSHDPVPSQPAQAPLWRRMTASAAAIAAVSAAQRRQIIQASPALAAKTSLLYYALDLPDPTPQPLALTPPSLLFAGRLVPEKGLDVLLRCLPAVLDQFPQARLLVAGDGPQRHALEQLSTSLGLEQAVSFLGWVSPGQIPALLDRASLLIAPSLWQEPFGLVALQAMQMARPVVASRVGGLEELLDGGPAGLLVPPGNPPALAAAILRLFSNPALALQLGLRGRERALQQFGWPRCLDEYEALYRQVLA